ncbi:TolC family outer membrane protein [Novosphingobium profundi]|uniref:TolC family outer membrane protein n=1 Tax=Novosphingobium profundi TaxID=1774954 RepID=UPI001BDB2DBF|nr:TolC family outer membrane protein [Novosphingobium profundi]MBT0666974.1 TolC family outer membrane protein [Novosphingobium profundi]
MPSLSVAETLGDAIAAAYSGNPELQGNRDLVAASDEQVAQARAAYGPSLALSASHEFTSARIRGTLFPSSDAGFASSVELSLNQPLFTSGRISAGIDGAQAASLSLREGLRAQGQQLLLDVVNAYVSLQRDITLQAIAVENYDILRQQNQVTAARFALRDLTEPDLEQTSNRLELAAGRVLEARSAVEISAARYRHLVGHFPDDLAPLPGLPELPTLETLYVAAERFNPQLAKAHLVEEASRANVRAARAEMRPQVSAFSTLGRTPLSDYQNTVREEAVSAGIRVSLQLYSGGLQTSALREAIARNLADQQFTEETRRAMRESLAANWSFLRTAQATLPRYRAAVEAAKKAVDGVKKQETSGYRTLRDVLDVTNDLLNARIAAARAEADIYMRHVAILRDIGTLSIETLADLPPYDPDSRRSGVARYAGLPMRLVLGPLDRTFLPPAGDGARIDVEQSAIFEWDGQQVDLLQPVLPGSPTTSPVVAP